MMVMLLLSLAAAVRGQFALDGFNSNADGARRFAKFSTDLARASEPRQLCLTDRVAYQRAIEEVYWRHRIWPKENPASKPPLDAVISLEEVERKVSDYLRKSQRLTDEWQRPITPSELQTEMEGMASHCKQPDVLSELFAALGNDPFVIAECLARPIVAERLVSELSNHAKGRDGSARPPALELRDTARPTVMPYQIGDAYKLPEIRAPLDCTDNSWAATSIVNVPDARDGHTAVWTGSEMIIWGGGNSDGGHVNSLNTGGRYSPSTDSWTATTIASAPLGRSGQTAVWTGSEMIVWGGGNYPVGDLDTGGRYNPVSDTWTATSTANAPFARVNHTAVWTGNEIIVWGGYGCFGNCLLNSGGRYDPTTDAWTATSTMNAPAARWAHTAVRTGGEMIIWGGTDGMNYVHTGGRYNPATDSWTPTGLANAPLGRYAHTAVWIGSEMIVWGGVDETFNDTSTGGRYNPSTDSWIATSLGNAPLPRDSHSAVWTGSEMIVWGGYNYPPGSDLNTGGRYNPASDGWTPTTTANAPETREQHTAVWTGSEMIIWGGIDIDNPQIYLNTGGRYCAQSGPTPTPTPPSPTPTATPTPTPTSTPTPTATSTATATAAATATAGPSTTPVPTPTPTASPTATPTPTVTPAPTPTPSATSTPTPRPATLGNISTRLQVGTGANVMIAGFIVQGSAPKRVLIRAAGPSLTQFGVPNALPNPQMTLNDSKSTIGTNDDWQTTQIGGVITSDQVAEIQSSGLAPSDPAESAIIAILPPGSYTAIVQGVSDGTGVGIVEVYDLDATSSLLANISTRGFVQTGDNVMIGGFIVVTQPTRVIIRAIGPSLTQFGMPDALANPQLELHDSTSQIGRNDDWQTTQIGGIITTDQVAEIQKSQLAPTDPAEAAIIATLQPGSYTAVVRGVNNTTGNALVEVYSLP